MDVDHGGFVSPLQVIQTHHDLYLNWSGPWCCIMQLSHGCSYLKQYVPKKKKKQNKIPKTTTIYCPANSLTLNRKWQSCSPQLWLIPLKCGENFCVAIKPSLSSDIPLLLKWRPLVSTCPLPLLRTRCAKALMWTKRFGSGRDENPKLAHMKPQHTQYS